MYSSLSISLHLTNQIFLFTVVNSSTILSIFPISYRGKLVFRQMQVETTKTTKYLRFSCLLTYEEALAAGYVKHDSASVGLSIRI